MNKLSALKFIALLCFTIAVMAAQSQTKPFGAAITYSKNAENIARITNDSLVLIKGTTYRFTVDTPEDKGLISTGIAINDLASQLIAANGAALKYLVTDKAGVTKTEGEINTGDRLKVISPDGASKIYHISVEQMALSGCLSLVQAKLTANTSHNLIINFTAGQRSPDATLKIYVPAGINVTMENTTVNVIGRGDVKLSGLATQSIGRTGTKYSYSKVGNAAISGSATTGSVIILRHLDVRPANGADLEITIADVNLKKSGKYLFKATDNTS